MHRPNNPFPIRLTGICLSARPRCGLITRSIRRGISEDGGISERVRWGIWRVISFMPPIRHWSLGILQKFRAVLHYYFMYRRMLTRKLARPYQNVISVVDVLWTD